MIKNKDGIGSRFLREPGIGYARTYGNFQAGLPRVEEVPGAKQAGAAIGRKLIGAGTVGTVREGGKICLIKKRDGKSDLYDKIENRITGDERP